MEAAAQRRRRQRLEAGQEALRRFLSEQRITVPLEDPDGVVEGPRSEVVIDGAPPVLAALEMGRRPSVQRRRAIGTLLANQTRQQNGAEARVEGPCMLAVALHQPRIALGQIGQLADVHGIVEDRGERVRGHRLENRRPQEELSGQGRLTLEQVVEDGVAPDAATDQLAAPLDQTLSEHTTHVQAERRALRDQLLARVLAHSQQRRLDEGDDARGARRSGEEGDLAEAFARAEHGDALDMARGVFLQDLDAAGLHDVEGIAGPGLTNDDGARGHPDLVELAGYTRKVLSRETREDRRPCDRVDEVVHGLASAPTPRIQLSSGPGPRISADCLTACNLGPRV